MLSKESIKVNHEICLELLDKFLAVCEKNQINYYLAFGSCLGAVRHHGFIPWDINIDVLMTKEEFERLDAAMQKEDLGNMKWWCPSERIFSLLMRNDSLDYETEPNIDVSLYSNAPNNKFMRWLVFRAAYFNIKMFKLKNTKVKRAFPYNILKFITSLIPNGCYIGFVNMISKIRKGKKSMYNMVLLPSVWKNREYIKTEWYGDTPTYGTFEGRKVKILKNYHEYLTMRYGDYMTPTVWEEKGEYKHVAK